MLRGVLIVLKTPVTKASAALDKKKLRQNEEEWR